MMKCLNSTRVRCSSSVVRCAELLDERRICKDQESQRCAANIEADEEKSE